MANPPYTEPLAEEDAGSVESVREIARIRSFSEALARVNELNAAQWTATLADVSEFAEYRGDFDELKGSLLGFNSDPALARLAITNRVRERLGYGPVDEYGVETGGANAYSQSMRVTQTF